MSFDKKEPLHTTIESPAIVTDISMFVFKVTPRVGRSVRVIIANTGCILAHEIGKEREGACLMCEGKELLKHRAIIKAIALALYARYEDSKLATKEFLTMVRKLKRDWLITKMLISVLGAAAIDKLGPGVAQKIDRQHLH
jgi:hypothetical protein